MLSDVNGKNKFNIGSTRGQLKFQLKLPADMSCDHCVFQWKYQAGNNWGIDPVTGQSGLGFGPQEQFYGVLLLSYILFKCSHNQKLIHSGISRLF